MNDKDKQILLEIEHFCLGINEHIEIHGNTLEDITNKISFQESVKDSISKIGSLITKLSRDFLLDSVDDAPFVKILDMSNLFAHDYLTVVLSEIWNLVTNEIPALLHFVTLMNVQNYLEEPDDQPWFIELLPPPNKELNDPPSKTQAKAKAKSRAINRKKK
ncbi:MAG: DUF86 domain-containing protein [Deltaproteobacteria bacterium]|jgi:uncharacterized protein with HEPN domain|nr:DUF86 domain-containing protein [Deltaproteobacteria bacterium]